MLRLDGKVALVTGVSSGIGRALVLELAAAGAFVVGVARDRRKLDALEAELARRGLAGECVACDLAVEAELDALCERVEARHGTPDLVVNNAGAGRFRFLDEVEPDENRRMLAVPFLSYVRITERFLPGMLERGHGELLFVNSGACYLPFPGATSYVTSRFAVRGFFEALRADLAGSGVRPRMFIPWIVDSDYFSTNERSMERLPIVAKIIPPLSCEETARKMVRALDGGRTLYVFPFLAWVLCLTGHHFPGFGRWVSRVTGHARPAARAGVAA